MGAQPLFQPLRGGDNKRSGGRGGPVETWARLRSKPWMRPLGLPAAGSLHGGGPGDDTPGPPAFALCSKGARAAREVSSSITASKPRLRPVWDGNTAAMPDFSPACLAVIGLPPPGRSAAPGSARAACPPVRRTARP